MGAWIDLIKTEEEFIKYKEKSLCNVNINYWDTSPGYVNEAPLSFPVICVLVPDSDEYDSYVLAYIYPTDF